MSFYVFNMLHKKLCVISFILAIRLLSCTSKWEINNIHI